MNNLPPGVSAGDIPGNSQEEAAYTKDEEELEGAMIEAVVDTMKDSRTHLEKEDGNEVMQRIMDSVDWEAVFNEVREWNKDQWEAEDE